MAVSDRLYPVFLAAVLLLFFLCRTVGQRRILLLAASYLFCGFFSPVYALLLAAISLLAYGAGLVLEKGGAANKSFLLTAILTMILLPMVYFKYANFIVSQLYGTVLASTSPVVTLLLPVGISFYTFQAIAYVVDVHLGRLRAEAGLAKFLLFMAFFPKLTQGPIERGENLLPQLTMALPLAEDFRAGLRAILFGLTLKLVFADSLGGWVNEVYDHTAQHSALELSIATLFYAFQAYCDFAGYSLIAIGSGRMLGLKLMTNFRQPYLAQNIPEFWRRWHISLTSWLRDYLFLPLVTTWRNLGNLAIAAAFTITFVLAGLWHGAGWTFIVFGFCHGIMLTVSHFSFAARTAFWKKLRIPAPPIAFARTVCTVLLVTLTFVLFRSPDLPFALTVYSRIFSAEWLSNLAGLHPPVEMKTGFLIIGCVVAIDLFCRHAQALWQRAKLLRYCVYEGSLLLVACKWFLTSSTMPFIYGRF